MIEGKYTRRISLKPNSQLQQTEENTSTSINISEFDLESNDI